MSDPKRLSQVTDNEVERMLLGAGADRESAPRGSRNRAWMAASAALATTTVATGTAAGTAATGTSTVAGHAAAIAKAGTAASLKWIGVISFVGLGAAAGAGALVLHDEKPETPVEAHVAASGEPHLALPPQPAPVATPTPTASASAKPFSQPASRATNSTAAELTTLDSARSALDFHDPAGALSVLDRYDTSYPHGTLQPEATLLRIEALIDAGDRRAAQRTAATFLTATPDSPYAKRIHSLLSGEP
jgi:hypothetical protein